MRDESGRPTERQGDLGPFRGCHANRERAHAVVYLEGRSFFIDLEEDHAVVVGRSEEADVQLPTPTMSRQHFELRWSKDRLTVQDCGSTNSTYLNGERLKEAALLSGGDQISAGDALVVFGITSPQPLLQRLRPAEVFEKRLGAALVRASRLGRMLALVRLHIEGSHELAVSGFSRVISTLPGLPIGRAIGPLDFHILVDEGVDQVRSTCATLEMQSSALGYSLSFGVSLAGSVPAL